MQINPKDNQLRIEIKTIGRKRAFNGRRGNKTPDKEIDVNVFSLPPPHFYIFEIFVSLGNFDPNKYWHI